MVIDFDSKEYIEQIQITEQLTKLNETRVLLARKILSIKNEISSNQTYILEKKKELKKYNIFNRFNENSRREIVFIKESIAKYEKEISQKQKEFDELNKELEIVKNRIIALEKIKKQNKEVPALKTDGATLIITDDESIKVKQDASDESLMVHCTDFFPRDRKILCNYDGRKIGEVSITYKGVTKKCRALSHRRSCHFTLNNAVKSTGDGAGAWDQPKFIIIDPLKNNEDKLLRINPSDSWTYGSVTLGEKPILLVREDAFEEIPKDQFSNYNIIKYNGDYITCVRNAIRLFGYKIKTTDANNAGHSTSIEHLVEKNLDYRNLCLNYIFDNSYNGIDNIFLSNEQLAYFYGVFNAKTNKVNLVNNDTFYSALSELSGVPVEFVKFVINNGIQKKNDKYTFKNDDELYFEAKRINNYSANKNNVEDFLPFVSENIDIEDIQEMYRTYINNAKDEVTEKQKMLFEYGQEFGNFKGALTGDILSEEQNNLFEEYQQLLEKQVDSLSDDELKIVIEVQNIKLSLLSKSMREKKHCFKVFMDEEITSEESEKLKRVGAYFPMRKKGLSLYFNAPDITDTMSKISGINIYKIWDQMNQTVNDEEMYELNRKASEFSEYHSLVSYPRGIKTDCNLSDCKTVKQLSDRIMKYAKLYERFYNGEKIDFDEKGNLISLHSLQNGTSSIEQENFEQAQREFEEEQKRQQIEQLAEEELRRQADLAQQGNRHTI